MIQRKQTIWLLVATIIIIMPFILPYGIHKEDSSIPTETMLTAKNNLTLMLLTIVTAQSCFFTIFLYKNRKQQLKFILIPLSLAIIMFCFEIFHSIQTNLGNKPVFGLYGSTLIIGFCLPLIAVVFLVMAYNGIKSDEKLVRDTDRLR